MVLCLVVRKAMSLLVEDLFCLERMLVMRGWDACNGFECIFVTWLVKLLNNVAVIYGQKAY
jgi:hypothetical protein